MESLLQINYSPISRYSISKYDNASTSYHHDRIVIGNTLRAKSRISTSEENTAPRYIHMLGTFDNMLETFDHTETPHKSEEKVRVHTEISQRSKTPTITYNTNLKIHLNHNNKKSKFNFPLSRRFKNCLDQEETVGPGSYFKPVKNDSPSFRFPSSPRMRDSISHKMAEYSRVLKSQKFSNIDHLERNKLFTSYNREAVIYNIQSRAKKNREKAEFVLSKKRRITLDTINSKRDHIHQKCQRYDWRLRKDEFIKVRKSWSDLVVISAISLILSAKIQSWRIFKIRTRKLLRAFFVIIKAVAKFKRRLAKIRVRSAIKKLAPLKVFFLMKFNQIRVNYSDIVLDTCEQNLHGSNTIMFLSILKMKIIFIQRSIRHFLICQDARRTALKIMWFKRKEELFSDLPIKSSPIIKISVESEMLSLPDLIIHRYIHKYIGLKFSEYSERLDEYQFYSQSLDKDAYNLNTSNELFIEKNHKKFVGKPTFHIYIKSLLLDSLIKEAYTRIRSDRRKNIIALHRTSILLPKSS